jgi:hypothetical protein
MAGPEARRHDLYHGLEEVLGTDRADTLMAYLPSRETTDLATGADVVDLRADIHQVRAEVHRVRGELKSEIQDVRGELKSVNQRLDRLFLTLAAGLMATTGAVVASLFVG